MSDLKMTYRKVDKTQKKVKKATSFLKEIAELSKGKGDSSFFDTTKPPTRSSDAQRATQLNTGWPPLPLRTIPICEFCYMNIGNRSRPKYCREHDLGGHTNCYKLHLTTVHGVLP